jgi:enamine deaminase RidA (YjgF/YER057c/UK114 family)
MAPPIPARRVSRGSLCPALAVALLAPVAFPAAAQVTRVDAPGRPYAASVRVPAGATVVHVSGIVADPGGAGDAPRWGDTEAQARAVLRQLAAALAAQRMTVGDVVALRVYLVAPPGAERMDYAGFSRAYAEVFGQIRPARATVEVRGLVDPGQLVEIEATAARAAPCGRRSE